MNNSPERNRGFVLITSLIFLVVVTLLAVSAMNSSTLQEKMARNAHERTLALQTANAALRQAEALLAGQAFRAYRPAGTTVDLSAGKQVVMPKQIHIWRHGAMFTATGENRDNNRGNGSGADRFLLSGTWNNGHKASSGKKPIAYTPYVSRDGKPVPTASYYIAEYRFHGHDLNPDTAARGKGTVIYRITARGQGADPSAVVITQSRYAKHY